MTDASLIGRLNWSGGMDDEGHRTYDIEWLVKVADAWLDGPVKAMQCPALPDIFSTWDWGNDIDDYAYCTPSLRCRPIVQNEATDMYVIGQTFTTKPFTKNQGNPDNPLLNPPEISGSFTKFTREATRDKNGKGIKSSSHERFKGSVTERDYSRHNVQIKMVSATLPLTTYVQYIDSVNSVSMWGLSARMVKLSNVAWTKHFYGSAWASVYYDITYEFDIDFQTFRRYIMDEGTKVLKSGGTLTNPKDFEPYLVKGQPSPVILNGSGVAATSEGAIGYLPFDLYNEQNLLLLGVPSTL